jgi:hypothetical protein
MGTSGWTPCWRQLGRLGRCMSIMWQHRGGSQRLASEPAPFCLSPACLLPPPAIDCRSRATSQRWSTGETQSQACCTERIQPSSGGKERRQAGARRSCLWLPEALGAASGCGWHSMLPLTGRIWRACLPLHCPAQMHLLPSRSWNLINEPRCKYCGPEAVDSWIGEMAAHLKVRCHPPAVLLRPHIDALRYIWNTAAYSTCTCAAAAHAALPCPALHLLQSVDPNHMVTTGAEGFIAEGDPSGLASE